MKLERAAKPPSKAEPDDISQPVVRSNASKRGRPRIHPDRKAYKADHERKRRAKLKEGK